MSSETQVFGVVLPVDMAKTARVVAAYEGKSRSQLMRDLLEAYLTRWAEERQKPSNSVQGRMEKVKLDEG